MADAWLMSALCLSGITPDFRVYRAVSGQDPDRIRTGNEESMNSQREGNGRKKREEFRKISKMAISFTKFFSKQQYPCGYIFPASNCLFRLKNFYLERPGKETHKETLRNGYFLYEFFFKTKLPKGRFLFDSVLLIRLKIFVMNKPLLFKKERCGKRLYLEGVVYLTSAGNYTHIHLLNGSPIILCCSLKSMLDKLPGSLYIQIHRAYVVALEYITELHYEYVKTPLKDLPVAKQFRKGLRDRFEWLE